MGLGNRMKPTAGCGPCLVTWTRHKQREGLLASPNPSTNFLGRVVSQWMGLVPEGASARLLEAADEVLPLQSASGHLPFWS